MKTLIQILSDKLERFEELTAELCEMEKNPLFTRDELIKQQQEIINAKHEFHTALHNVNMKNL